MLYTSCKSKGGCVWKSRKKPGLKGNLMKRTVFISTCLAVIIFTGTNCGPASRNETAGGDSMVNNQKPVQAEDVVITNEQLGKLPIDIKQGGQFIEPLCNLIPSMIEQQVANDSFEDEPPFRFEYVKETDKAYRPWYPSGSVHLAAYSLETQGAFNGRQCLKVALPAQNASAGISQDGFFLTKGTVYTLRLHMKGEGGVAVRTYLHGDGTIVSNVAELGNAADAWAPVRAKLRAKQDVENATLTIEFSGPGSLYLDRVYLISERAVQGLWRRDVVEAVKALNPGVIRWGGSAMEVYDWTACIGPWDKRAPYTTMWGGLEANFVGPEEFVQFCRLVGAEPLICIRWSGKAPADAAAQIEYFNGSPESPWGSVRARNGHRDPYNVKYWQIGNEVGGPGYDDTVAAFAKAMKEKDPSIKLLAAFNTDQTLVKGEGLISYLCPHHYDCRNLPDCDASFAGSEAIIKRDDANVRMAITEWNTTPGDFGLKRGSLQTLSNAISCSRYQNLLHRRADLCEMAMRSNLIDSFGSGILVTGPGWIYFSPTYYSQQMYQAAAGSYPLKLERGDKTAWHDVMPDLSAVISEDGKTLRIFGVNSTDQPRRVRFRLGGFDGRFKNAGAIVLKNLQQPLSVESMNTRDNPRRICTTKHAVKLSGDVLEVVFDPCSVIRVDVNLAGK